MKKLLSFVLVLVLCLSFASCGYEPDPVNEKQDLKKALAADRAATEDYNKLYGTLHESYHKVKEFKLPEGSSSEALTVAKKELEAEEKTIHSINNAQEFGELANQVYRALEGWISSVTASLPEVAQTEDFIALAELIKTNKEKIDETIKSYNKNIDVYNEYRSFAISEKEHIKLKE